MTMFGKGFPSGLQRDRAIVGSDIAKPSKSGAKFHADPAGVVGETSSYLYIAKYFW